MKLGAMARSRTKWGFLLSQSTIRSICVQHCLPHLKTISLPLCIFKLTFRCLNFPWIFVPRFSHSIILRMVINSGTHTQARIHTGIELVLFCTFTIFFSIEIHQNHYRFQTYTYKLFIKYHILTDQTIRWVSVHVHESTIYHLEIRKHVFYALSNEADRPAADNVNSI